MPVSSSTRRAVRERANLHCEYCHADERWQFIRFTIDHVLPQAAGGSIHDIPLVRDLVARLREEYQAAKKEISDRSRPSLLIEQFSHD